MKEERAQYIADILALDGDVNGREMARAFIADSDVWVHGAPAPFPYVPYLFNKEDRAYIADQVTTMHRILCKVIRRYLDDESYRELFHFPEELHRLIMLPCDYDDLLPMARFDLFLNEEDLSYKFCEFNTDGSGAMSRDYMIGKASCKARLISVSRKITSSGSSSSSTAGSSRSCAYTSRAPVHAPIPPRRHRFSRKRVFSDFNRFIEAFQKAGYDARFTDIRDFEFDGEHLIDSTDGQIVDAIYRRAVTSEILQHPGECDGLIDAVAAGKVCLIGHFRTTVVHSKEVNIALFDERTRAFLTEEEVAFVDAHVPRTYRLESGVNGFTLDEVKSDKDAWIIKPADDYGAHGVYPGVDFDQEQWGLHRGREPRCRLHRAGVLPATPRRYHQHGHR